MKMARSFAPNGFAAVLIVVLAVLAAPLALAADSVSGAGGAAGTAPAGTAPAAAPEVPALLLGPAMSQATPVLVCGVGYYEGFYALYYSDPAKTHFVCSADCGVTDCPKPPPPYVTVTPVCCPKTGGAGSWL